jgi:hypothetical protein
LVTVVILAALPRRSSEEVFVRSLGPIKTYIYPADPRNGGFTEMLFDFPQARMAEIRQSLDRHFQNLADCKSEDMSSNSTIYGHRWNNAADTWAVEITNEELLDQILNRETRSHDPVEHVCRVMTIRKSTWVETLRFELMKPFRKR